MTKNKTDFTMSPFLSTPNANKSKIEYYFKTGIN